jgi:tRNA acetyltransferase TAN1
LVYDFNLLVSHGWWSWYKARQEALGLLKEFGDDHALVSRTVARGLAGVKTVLNNRGVVASLTEKFSLDPSSVQFTLKWTPIDLWCESTIESMKQSLASLKAKIEAGESWMMHVEKRGYTAHHSAEVIEELAVLIDEKVDLKNPDRVVWIEILGGQAGMSVIRPGEVFSLYKARGHRSTVPS